MPQTPVEYRLHDPAHSPPAVLSHSDGDGGVDAIIARAAEAAREMLGMDMAYVADTRLGLQDYRVLTGDGESFGAAVGRPIALEGTYCQQLLNGRLDNIVRDARSDPEVSGLAITEQAGIGSYIGVPVVFSDGQVYGTFCCVSHEPEPELRDRDVRFMQVFARLIADQLADEARQAEDRRLEMTAANVHALLTALAARDGYTEAHSQAVVALAVDIARKLGVSDQKLMDVENAALLHDIGKIGVPDAVLHKPGKLTAAEWDIMRRHPIIGEQIVSSMKPLAHLAPIVRAEHERFDGRGYPDGLRGGQIPLASRIILVADAYHAMMSDRPYRAALGHDAALAELKRNAGSQFCPATVRAALAALRDRD
ncbi:MAG: HD domain-containing phosphohydrolase [Solirubrobacteraceae bacterium]